MALKLFLSGIDNSRASESQPHRIISRARTQYVKQTHLQAQNTGECSPLHNPASIKNAPQNQPKKQRINPIIIGWDCVPSCGAAHSHPEDESKTCCFGCQRRHWDLTLHQAPDAIESIQNGMRLRSHTFMY